MEKLKKMAILLGEGPSAALTARFVLKCPDLRDSDTYVRKVWLKEMCVWCFYSSHMYK